MTIFVTNTSMGGRRVSSFAEGRLFKRFELLALLWLRNLAGLAVLVNSSLANCGKAVQDEGRSLKRKVTELKSDRSYLR